MIKKVEPTVDTVDIGAKIRQFLALKSQEKLLKSHLSDLSKEVAEIVETYGEVDDHGHIYFDLPNPINGYSRLVRQRRVKKTLDEDAAEQILQAKQLDDRCYETVKVLNESEVFACLAQGLLTDDDINTMYPEQIQWALVPEKE